MTTLPKRALALSALALGAAAVAAPAAQAGVTLDWTVENAYASGCSATGLNCTWLGYSTNPTPGAGANGTASPLAPATGPTVTPASARGAGELASWKLPAVTGSIELGSFRGAMEFDGGVQFVAPAPPAGHGFTISLEDPRVVLDGTGGGLLYASGLRTPGAPGSAPVLYNQDEPVFRLTGAAQSLNADGSTSISLVPEIATASYAFPANYGVGAGPNRTPNTFGSFTIAVAPNGGPAGANGRDGTNGANGKDGANGKNGTDGKNGTTTVVRVQTTTLAKAPFAGKAARKVRVTARGKNAVLATGTVKGRKLNVTLAKGKKSLPGVVTLHVVGSKTKANVRL